jgi:adenosylmethionine-8-amino-7-oxononanoate aminotransferase
MDVFTAPSPDAYLRAPGSTAAEHARQAGAALEQLFDRHGGEIAALIVEPLVQCAGNMRMYDPEYLRIARALCNHHEVHLIADEVAVGFGRTGTMFACEQAGIAPDLLCLSKGLSAGYLPISTVLATEAIYGAFYDEYTRLNAFLHSHSYAGNPLACSAALASLAIFREDDVLVRNRALIEHLHMRSRQLFGTHPRVSDLRQCGTICAIEFVRDAAARTPYPWTERRNLRIYRHALERGVLLRPLGNVIYVMPPYVITTAELDTVLEVAREGLDLATCG